MLLLSLPLLLLGGVVGAETDETMTVMEGDSVTLHTNLTKVLNDDTILWLFGPKQSVISQIMRKGDLNSIYFTDDVRFRGRLQVDQNTGSLTIRNTRIRHSGQYKLSISRKKITTKIFNVTVFDVVGETDGVKSVSVKEGESVTLNTDVSEVQREDLIVWRFGDKGILLAKIDVETNETSLNEADERFRDRLKLDQQTGSLTITNTRTTDSGLYELQIIGRESSQRFLLSVTGAVPDPGLSPGAIAGIVVAALLVAAVLSSVVIYYRRKISGLEVVNKVSVADGDSVILDTGTVLQKDDKIKWWYLHDNDLIAEINGGTKEHDGLDKRFRSKLKLDDKTGSLTINYTMPIHSGLYILEISSKTGRSIKRFSLTVEKQIEEKIVSVEDGDSVTLETGTVLQEDDEIKWWYQHDNDLIAEINGRTKETYDGLEKRFRSKLELDKAGSLTISNTMPIHSGLYILEISSKTRRTIKKRFILTVEMRTVPVQEGEDVSLKIETMKQTDNLILWTFGPENRLVVKADSATSVGKRFKDRLELNHQTGSLTIKDIQNTDSGHFKLQLINSEQTTFKRFNVTVTGPTGEQPNDSMTVKKPLLDEVDEIYE